MKLHYSPISPVYYEIFASELDKENSKVFYFDNGTDIEEAKGIIRGLVNNGLSGEYLILDSGLDIRIDRIITINGIPGPAYDEYDTYVSARVDYKVPSDLSQI